MKLKKAPKKYESGGIGPGKKKKRSGVKSKDGRDYIPSFNSENLNKVSSKGDKKKVAETRISNTKEINAEIKKLTALYQKSKDPKIKSKLEDLRNDKRGAAKDHLGVGQEPGGKFYNT